MSEPATPDTTLSYVSRWPCGCIGGVAVDNPGNAANVAEIVAHAVRNGIIGERIPTAEARKGPWGCSGCERARELAALPPVDSYFLVAGDTPELIMFRRVAGVAGRFDTIGLCFRARRVRYEDAWEALVADGEHEWVRASDVRTRFASEWTAREHLRPKEDDVDVCSKCGREVAS